MKKSFFKTAVCLVLSLAMLLCFASCGSSSDKYVDRLDDLKRDGEINGYYDVDEDSMDYYEESYNESYDIDVEIEAMYRVSEGSLLYGSSVTIIEFKTASQAKSYQKAYEEQMNIGFSAKVGRVLSFFTKGL